MESNSIQFSDVEWLGIIKCYAWHLRWFNSIVTFNKCMYIHKGCENYESLNSVIDMCLMSCDDSPRVSWREIQDMSGTSFYPIRPSPHSALK